MWAVIAHRPEAVGTLCRLGADIALRDTAKPDAPVIPGKQRDLGDTALDLAQARRDKDPKCAELAARGDCDEKHHWMNANCWTSCDRLLHDALSHPECEAIVASGGCRTREGLSSCRTTCMARLQANQSLDTEGNCWYWATDGEVRSSHI